MDLKFLLNEDIDTMSKALTHMIFRNGEVENIHAEGKLSASDMKRLNKDVQNRIAGLITAGKNGDYTKLFALYAFSKLYGSDWDKCEPYPLDKF